MQNRFVKVTLIGALTLAMLGTVGCERTKAIKADERKPEGRILLLSAGSASDGR